MHALASVVLTMSMAAAQRLTVLEAEIQPSDSYRAPEPLRPMIESLVEHYLGLSVVRHADLDRDAAKQLGQCRADRVCALNVLRRAEIDLSLSFRLDFSGQPPSMEAELLRTKDQSSVGRVTAQLRHGLKESVRDLIDRLMTTVGKTKGALLLVAVRPRSATVEIDDGVHPANRPIAVMPGRHSIVVRKDGFRPHRLEVELLPDSSLTIGTVVLDEDRPVYATWWFWTIIGAVVAGGVAAGVALGQHFDQPDSYKVCFGCD